MQRTGPPSREELATPVASWSDACEPNGRTDRSRRTRRALLLAAAREFDAHGYHAATLRDIVRGADVTKGALYFHFDSKKDMTDALVEEVRESWLRLCAEIGTRGLDPLWSLLVETDAYVARWSHDPIVRGVSRALSGAEDLADQRTRWMNEWAGATQAHFRRAAARGLLRPAADPERVGGAVQALSAGAHVLSEMVPESASYWSRMNEAWNGLLPVVASDAWLAQWRDSPWADRPLPDPDAFDRARRP